MLKAFDYNKSEGILEIDKENLLQEFNFSENQFIDLCILLGCDFCPRIKGIGPKMAYKLIQEEKNLENIIKKIKNDNKKIEIPEIFPYEDVRNIFLKPNINENVNVINLYSI